MKIWIYCLVILFWCLGSVEGAVCCWSNKHCREYQFCCARTLKSQSVFGVASILHKKYTHLQKTLITTWRGPRCMLPGSWRRLGWKLLKNTLHWVSQSVFWSTQVPVIPCTNALFIKCFFANLYHCSMMSRTPVCAQYLCTQPQREPLILICGLFSKNKLLTKILLN